MEHPRLARSSPLTRVATRMVVATAGGAEVEGEGNTALLGVARTWTSVPTLLHAGLTPNHALEPPHV